MPTKTIQKGFEIYTIATQDQLTRASFIPERGGIGLSIVMPYEQREREILYLHDFFWNKHWHDLPGGWPFLFPVCARLERMGELGKYLYDGHVYKMPMHGFGWGLPWQVTQHGKDNITLELHDNKETRDLFPFAFAVILTYRVSEGRLICEQSYINQADKPMPYYAGFHPYFLMPGINAEKHSVSLDYVPLRRFVYNDKFTDIIGETNLFHLPTQLDDQQLNEQLTQLGQDKEVHLFFKNGFGLHLRVDGLTNPNLFSYLQLYHIPEKPFFCVEPWMSFPNALNTVCGVRWLNPGATDKAVLTLWCSNR